MEKLENQTNSGYNRWEETLATLERILATQANSNSTEQHLLEEVTNGNRELQRTVTDLLQQLGIDKPLGNKKLFLRYGGPVESGRGFILHTDEVIRKESITIDKGIVLTSTAEFFGDLAKVEGPKKSILALGYAGWEPGQLEKEITSNSWMKLSTDSGFLLDEESASRVIEFIEERSKIIFAEMGLKKNIIKASFNEKHRDNLLFVYNKI